MGIVDLSPVEKLLKSKKKIPSQIIDSLQVWVEQVEKFGLFETQKVSRWKDHSLTGLRKGQRAIRRSFQWRAIYSVKNNGSIHVVLVEEVTPHDYR